MIIFVDTSALYALLDADDDNHECAKAAWKHWLEQPDYFATSNYVLVESLALIQARLGMEAVRRFQEDLAPLLQTHWVTVELHTTAIAALLVANRRGLSLVDCASFELMHWLGLRTVFAFDGHFEEQGFTCLP
jgi:predicted nucleic acid-binding protein